MNALANGARPRLDASGLSVYRVEQYDATRIRVIFHYRVVYSAEASEVMAMTVEEVTMALVQGRNDNSTESMELDEDIAPTVMMGASNEATSSSSSTMTDTMHIIIYAASGLAACLVVIGSVMLCRWNQRRIKRAKLEKSSSSISSSSLHLTIGTDATPTASATAYTATSPSPSPPVHST